MKSEEASFSDFELRPKKGLRAALLCIDASLWIMLVSAYLLGALPLQTLPISCGVVLVFSIALIPLMLMQEILISGNCIEFSGIGRARRSHDFHSLVAVRLASDPRRRGVFPSWFLQFADHSLESFFPVLYQEEDVCKFLKTIKRFKEVKIDESITEGYFGNRPVSLLWVWIILVVVMMALFLVKKK